jgi:F-type H+-transporting ATPase subunit b
MPQLEVQWFASQIFWLALMFSLLYWLLSRKALPRLTEVIDARHARIAKDLEEAQRQRAEAEEALTRYEQQIGAAREEAQALLGETLSRLQDQEARRQKELDEKLTGLLREAEERIAKAKTDALKELEEGAASAAQAAIERLIGTKVTKKAAQAALREVLEEAA